MEISTGNNGKTVHLTKPYLKFPSFEDSDVWTNIGYIRGLPLNTPCYKYTSTEVITKEEDIRPIDIVVSETKMSVTVQHRHTLKCIQNKRKLSTIWHFNYSYMTLMDVRIFIN